MCWTRFYLIFFSIFGTLARLGLQALTFYPGAPVVTGVLWANGAGSLVMGFFLEDRRVFQQEWGTPVAPRNYNNEEGEGQQHKLEDEEKIKIKKHESTKETIPLYITSFCGSFSFSSFTRDIFLALSNAPPPPQPDPHTHPPTTFTVPNPVHRNGGYSFMALMAVILLTLSISLSALLAGAHPALATDKLTPTLPFRLTRRVLDPVFVVLGWGCCLGAVFMAIWPPDRHSSSSSPETWRGRAIFSLVFAPLSCLLRFYLSLYLNTALPSFPLLGTFASNILGTLVLGLAYNLQHVDFISGNVRVSWLVVKCCKESWMVLWISHDGEYVGGGVE